MKFTSLAWAAAVTATLTHVPCIGRPLGKEPLSGPGEPDRRRSRCGLPGQRLQRDGRSGRSHRPAAGPGARGQRGPLCDRGGPRPGLHGGPGEGQGSAAVWGLPSRCAPRWPEAGGLPPVQPAFEVVSLPAPAITGSAMVLGRQNRTGWPTTARLGADRPKALRSVCAIL